jgi:hypothetical protein
MSKIVLPNNDEIDEETLINLSNNRGDENE